MAKKFQVVELQTTDHTESFKDLGVLGAYTLDKWKNVLIIEIKDDFNINVHANSIRRAFGYGANRPVIFTKQHIEFFCVEEVEQPSLWQRIKAFFKRK